MATKQPKQPKDNWIIRLAKWAYRNQLTALGCLVAFIIVPLTILTQEYPRAVLGGIGIAVFIIAGLASIIKSNKD